MKTILCIIGGELTTENETALMQYDNDDTIIHLFTNAISDRISIGKMLDLLNQLEIAEDAANRMFISDMPDYLETAVALFGNPKGMLFGQFLKLPQMGNSYSSGNLINEESDKNKVLILSFLVDAFAEQQDFHQMTSLVLNSMEFTLYNRYYYWRQTMRICLRKKNLRGNEQLAELYQQIYQGYYEACKDLLNPIYKEDRHEDQIYVLTLQFIGLQHPPTRSALERIAVLCKNLNKQVKVINTREPMTWLGEFPMFAAEKASVNESISGCNAYQYDGMNFTLDQSSKEMPEIGEVRRILEGIRQDKPYMILVIGNSSIVADMAAHIVPVITIPVTISSVIPKPGQFTASGKVFQKDECQRLFHSDHVPDNVIESTFTFSLKEQKQHYCREDFGLPKDKFLLLVVGTRLHDEVDDEFIEALKPLFLEGAFLVLAGQFHYYEKWCEKDEELKNHSAFVGYQDDIMAFDELVDLYVNPRRIGGGYSVVEAFAKGIPCVTIRYGDIAVVAGDDFCVTDYAQMQDVIRRYQTDRSFYQMQQEKAKKRVKEVTDTAGTLRYIMNEAQSRELFF